MTEDKSLDGMHEQTTWSEVNETNMTTLRDLGEIDKAWYIVYNAILIAITVVGMFSMGTTIKLNYLKIIIRRPVAPAIGAISQVILVFQTGTCVVSFVRVFFLSVCNPLVLEISVCQVVGYRFGLFIISVEIM